MDDLTVEEAYEIFKTLMLETLENYQPEEDKVKIVMENVIKQLNLL